MRTTEIVRRIEKIALDTPGIIHVAAFAGLSGATRTQASNAAALFPVFEDPEVRLKKGLSAAKITGDLRKRLSALEGAFIIVIPPPSIRGIGTGGGFTMRIQDRALVTILLPSSRSYHPPDYLAQSLLCSATFHAAVWVS